MLSQFDSLYILPTKIIKLRFRYILPNRQIKFVIFTLETSRVETNTLSVRVLLESVIESLITPILLLQNNRVIWDTVSIIYPLKKDNKSDLLKLPLLNVKGFVESETDSQDFNILNMSVRFSGKPLPLVTKVYGIDTSSLTTNADSRIIEDCNNIYNKTHIFNACGITYYLIFLSKNYKNNTTIKKKPIMAFTTIL